MRYSLVVGRCAAWVDTVSSPTKCDTQVVVLWSIVKEMGVALEGQAHEGKMHNRGPPHRQLPPQKNRAPKGNLWPLRERALPKGDELRH